MPVTALGCQTTKSFWRIQPRGREEGLPVEAGRAGDEVLPRPVVVALPHVLRVLAAHMRLGDAVLQLEDPRGLRISIGDAGELQHGGDVRLILRSDLRHARRLVEVVVAVRHAQAALQQEGRIAGRVVEVLRDPEAEQVVGVEIRVVQHVDVGAQRASERASEGMGIGDRREARRARAGAARAPSPRWPLRP